MTKEERTDLFLEAFFAGEPLSPEREAEYRASLAEDKKIGDREKSGPGLWEEAGRTVSCEERKKPALSARSRSSILLVLAAIPFLIWLGMSFMGDRKYLIISLIIVVLAAAPFFISFEGRKPSTRELMIIAVLAALAVAVRAVFFMLPNLKPMAAIVILAAIAFGAESGFMVGALSMLASNMFFGQGPWTPWQMFAMGLIGLAAGIVFKKGWVARKRWPMAIFGFFLVVILYGGIMNPASLFMMTAEPTWQGLLAMYISGIPVDLMHGLSVALLLFLAGPALLEKLERIKVKYGLIERKEA